MIQIIADQILVILMIFLRVGGLVFTMPFLSDMRIPMKIKMLLTIIISYLIFYSVPNITVPLGDSLVGLILIGFKEILIGLIAGFAMNFIFWGISFAGSLIGFEMGLAMAQSFDPNTNVQNNLIGMLLGTSAILIFILINGHHYVLQAIMHSYRLIPVGEITLSKPLYDLLINYSLGIFIIAVKIASPLIVSFFMVHVAGGIISRIIPQMQVFFVLQPLQIGLGFLLLSFFVPIYVYFVKNALEMYEYKLMDIVKAMAS